MRYIALPLALALVAATLPDAAFLAATAARSTTGRRAAMAASATLGSAHALLHHLANVRRRAALLASGLLHLPDKLRFPDPFNPAGDLHFPATLLGVSFRSAFFFDVGTLTGAAIFFTGRVARGPWLASSLQ